MIHNWRSSDANNGHKFASKSWGRRMLSKKEAVGVTAVSKASAVGLSLIVTIWEQKVINAGKVFAEAVGNGERLCGCRPV